MTAQTLITLLYHTHSQSCQLLHHIHFYFLIKMSHIPPPRFVKFFLFQLFIIGLILVTLSSSWFYLWSSCLIFVSSSVKLSHPGFNFGPIVISCFFNFLTLNFWFSCRFLHSQINIHFKTENLTKRFACKTNSCLSWV